MSDQPVEVTEIKPEPAQHTVEVKPVEPPMEVNEPDIQVNEPQGDVIVNE